MLNNWVETVIRLMPKMTWKIVYRENKRCSTLFAQFIGISGKQLLWFYLIFFVRFCNFVVKAASYLCIRIKLATLLCIVLTGLFESFHCFNTKTEGYSLHRLWNIQNVTNNNVLKTWISFASINIIYRNNNVYCVKKECTKLHGWRATRALTLYIKPIKIVFVY